MTRFVALLLVSVTGFCTPAWADDLCPLVAELTGFLVANTSYHGVPCPVIGFAMLPGQGALRSQAGAYFPLTGAIELAPDLDLAGAYGQSFLLHELVHAAQYASGADRTAPCPAALEAEAYRVQAAFLRENGLPREALLTGFLADQLGRCGAEPAY
jgi:hypothetical protein